MEPLRPPAPAGPTYPADLSLFSGTPANGTWSLFIDDQTGGDDGQVFGGWSLNVTAAGEHSHSRASRSSTRRRAPRRSR